MKIQLAALGYNYGVNRNLTFRIVGLFGESNIITIALNHLRTETKSPAEFYNLITNKLTCN